jgi:hypothetical protein
VYEQGEAGVGLETSGQEEVRDKGVKGITSAAAEAFLFSCRRIFRRGLVPSDAYRVWLTVWREIRTGRERHWFQVRHAFWLLSDDRSARSHGAGSSLRALPIGHVSLKLLIASGARL